MSVRLEPDLLDAAERQPGDLVLTVHSPSQSDDVRSAIDSAAGSLAMVSHPDEPAEPWPNSAVLETSGTTPALRVDLADRSSYPGLAALAIGVLVAHLAAAGLDCTVGLAGATEPSSDADSVGHADAAVDVDGGPPEDAPAATAAGDHGDVRAFPWPAGWLPTVRQVARRRQMAVLIPRPADDVMDELAASIRARGRLTALGRVRRGSRPWMLLAELDGHTYAATLLAVAGATTDLSVTTPLSWPELSAEERDQAMRDVVWTVPPS